MSNAYYDRHQRNTYTSEHHRARRKRYRDVNPYHSSSRWQQYKSSSRSHSRSRSRSRSKSRVHRSNRNTRWSRSKSPNPIFNSIKRHNRHSTSTSAHMHISPKQTPDLQKDTKSSRKNKKWEEWEEQLIINERKNIIKYSNKKIKKISDTDWKYISSKLEQETQRRGQADIGREWNVVKKRFHMNISKNAKYYNDKAMKDQEEDIRVQLQKIEDFRGHFFGEFQSFGDDKGKKKTAEKKKKYICLTNIRLSDSNGEVLCDHVWLNVGKQIKDLGWIKKGGTIAFDARVTKYRKGSIKRGIKVKYDYKFSYPSKVKLHQSSIQCNNMGENVSVVCDDERKEQISIYDKNEMVKIGNICSILGINAKYGKLYHFKNHIELYKCVDDLISKYDDAAFKTFVENKKPCTQNWCRDIKQAFGVKGMVAPLDGLKKNICLRFNELKTKYNSAKQNQDSKILETDANSDNKPNTELIHKDPPQRTMNTCLVHPKASVGLHRHEMSCPSAPTVFQWNPFVQPSLPLFQLYPRITGLPPPMIMQPMLMLPPMPHVVSEQNILNRGMHNYLNNYNYNYNQKH